MSSFSLLLLLLSLFPSVFVRDAERQRKWVMRKGRTVAHKRRSIYLAAIGSSEWARSSISQRYHRAFLTIRHATLTISFLVPLLRVAFFHAALTVAPNLVNPQSRRPRDTPEIRWERRDTVAINQR